ncbi:FecR family protein [Dyadobacter sandarakinus]|uniref:FecR domain-containing protein n=1 Tax=Dyadobacter sandarakinus TaxID=2747268 RepID=A0ABX7I8A9_9BACT|nr:FecR family protein [Dyadobacter sandarakinus]QRR02159.1 FecR domain-containing protein [Dyadobacter sandarakinus]
MNNYTDYELADWLEDAAFQDWVYHHERDIFWQHYLNDHPGQRPVMEQARTILLSVRGELDVLSAAEVQARVGDIMRQISDEPARQSAPWWAAGWLRSAAMLILVAALGLAVWKMQDKLVRLASGTAFFSQSATTAHREIRNDNQPIKLVNLPDGSSVILKKHARISFPAQFEKSRREVSMSGEAFFEVVKNPAQPFYVYAGSMVTKVKGTSFSIKANEGEDEVNLVVKTGIVEVSAANRKLNGPVNKLILTPNKQVTFHQKSMRMITRSLQKPVLLDIPAEKQDLSFKRTPLTEVFTALEQTYGVDILFDKSALAHCTITARLGDEPISEKLDMICAVVNAKYEERGGAIHIVAAGCE